MTILLSLVWIVTILGLAGGAFGNRQPWMAAIAAGFAVFWAVGRYRNRGLAAARDAEPDLDYSRWPTSGPIGRLGQKGLLSVWTFTSLLSILNPVQAIQVVRQLLGNRRLSARERSSGNDGRNYETLGRYTLPFKGEWLVYKGGRTPKTSHSWDALGQRFALDFVMADEALHRHTRRGTRPADYFCYGAEIIAAADGTVRATENRVARAPFLGWGICDFTARHFVGNHVVIEHAAAEYGVYAHLITGTVRPRPGDRVRRGDVLGLCGQTGHSSEPHLHFHLQDSADLFDGMGLPVRFADLKVGGVALPSAWIAAGQRVHAMANPGTLEL